MLGSPICSTRPLSRLGTLLALVLLLTAAACAVTPPPAPRPLLLGEADVDALATLLRLEDRREYDAARLQELAGSATPEVRRRTALAAGRIRHPAATPLLLHLLVDPDTSVAATAAFALGQLGDTTAVPRLTALLEAELIDRAPSMATEAAAALGKLRTEEGRQALLSLLRQSPTAGQGVEEGSQVIEAALLAIWKFPRDPDLEPILRWTRHPAPQLRWRATYALVRRPDPAATATLLELASDSDPQVRSLAMRGLTAPLADTAGIAHTAVLPVLLAAVRDADYTVRVNAARALGTYSDATSVAALEELLRGAERHLALQAAESLERLGPRAAPSAPTLRTLALAAAQPIALRSAALLALVRVAPREAEPVAAAFAGDANWRGRVAAGRAFAALSPAPTPALEALIRDRDPRVASVVLGAAVAAAGDAAAPLRTLLIEALGSPDPGVRTAAFGGLERLADPSLQPLLLDAYARAQQDPANDAVLAAVDALASLHRAGAPVTRAFLQRFSRSPDYLVRQRVVSAFGNAARAAWGDPFPLETELTATDYRSLVQQWIAPVLLGAAAPRVRLETEAGSIELELFSADAPLTVQSFLSLAERGYFDGQEWPRVVPNFVIQGGDPRGDQTGGPGYAIRDELNRHLYLWGTLGMALSGPDTGGSQFFITHSPQPHLDGGYAVFGRVLEGMSVTQEVLPGERIVSIRRVP